MVPRIGIRQVFSLTGIEDNMSKLFTVYENNNVVAGLQNIPPENANIRRLPTRVPLKDLDVDDMTFANVGKEKYKIVRVK